MKLKEFRKDADYFSSTASSLNRNLSFSGIAVIWMFKQSVEGKILFDKILLWSLLLLSLSLLTDLAQYCIGYYIISSFQRKIEIDNHQKHKEINEEKIDVLAPIKIKLITNFFFCIKIAFNFIAFGLIIYFLFQNILINK